MTHLNVEFKARCANLKHVRLVLKDHQAEYKGQDRQRDTYFHAPHGRLKLREGSIENALIYYEREGISAPKDSIVNLVDLQARSPMIKTLKQLLTQAFGVLVVVDKFREIYFVGNVKIHLDQVKDLGAFVEIEAMDGNGDIGREHLEQQCQHYILEFGIRPEQLVSCSYSDMLLSRRNTKTLEAR